MRTILIILIFLFVKHKGISQQHSLGLKMGYSANKLIGETVLFDDVKSDIGYNFGFRYVLNTKSGFNFGIDLSYVQKRLLYKFTDNIPVRPTWISEDTVRFEYEESMIDMDNLLSYLSFPIRLGYEYNKKIICPYLSVGLLTSVMLSGKKRYYVHLNNLSGESTSSDEFTPIDMGVTVETGVRFQVSKKLKPYFSVIYEESLTPLFRSDFWVENKGRFSTFVFSLGVDYLFGKEK